MIEHHFNNDLQVLEVIYQGEIAPKDILAFSNFVSTNMEFPRKLKILTDARKATYNFDHETAQKLMSNLKKNLENYHSIMDAFIHAKPKETAYSQFLEIEKAYDNYAHKVFSTKEAAISWLMVDLF